MTRIFGAVQGRRPGRAVAAGRRYQHGLPGYHYSFWFGLYAPAGTPSAVVRRLHEAASRGLANPEVKEKIALQGMDAAPSASPDAFEAELREEAPMWQKLVRDSGAKIE